MKNLIILVVFGVAGYFAYQYFIDSSPQGSSNVKPTFNLYSLPERCQDEAENLQRAFSRHANGEIKRATLNGYAAQLRGCLKTHGNFTNSQIEEFSRAVIIDRL